MIPSWDTGYYARGMLCITCYNKKLGESRKRQCAGCGRWVLPEEGRNVDGRFYCINCAREEKKRIEKSTCAICKKRIKGWEKKHPAPGGKVVCDKCYRKGMKRLGAKTCYRCGKKVKVKFIGANGNTYCPKCWKMFGRFVKEKTLIEKLVRLLGKSL